MKRWHWLLTGFFVLTAIAAYGCWAGSSEYMMLHNYENPYPEAPWSDLSEWASGPGILVAFIALDRSDIPENAPDTWKTAWLIAPSSAAIWIGLYLLASKAIRYVWRFFFPQNRRQEIADSN